MAATPTFRREVTRILCNDRFKDSDTTKEVEQIIAAARSAGIDPDATIVEETAARWWPAGSRPPEGWFHNTVGYRYRFSDWTTHQAWHGTHATEALARGHYEESRAKTCTDPDCPDARGYGDVHPAPAQDEYDAGWVEEFFRTLFKRDTSGQQDRADLCKEAARREREKWAEERDNLRAKLDKYEQLLLWLLWHHQGGSSKVGQPIRAELGIGEYASLTKEQVDIAKAYKGAKLGAREADHGLLLWAQESREQICSAFNVDERDMLQRDQAELICDLARAVEALERKSVQQHTGGKDA